MSFWFPHEIVSLQFRCPHCKELMPPDVRECRCCGELITEEQAKSNILLHYFLTAAITRANFLKTFDYALFFYLTVSLIGLWMKWIARDEGIYTLWVVCEAFNTIWLLMSILIGHWLLFYGRWPIIDEEYRVKQREMWTALRLWLAAYAVHYLLTFAII